MPEIYMFVFAEFSHISAKVFQSISTGISSFGFGYSNPAGGRQDGQELARFHASVLHTVLRGFIVQESEIADSFYPNLFMAL